jgi:hypothetical protein
MVVLRAVPEFPLKAGDWPATRTANPGDRIWVRRAQARRRWALRSGLLLGITGVVITLLIIWRRDTVAMQDVSWTTERACQAIQAHLDKTRLLPDALPKGTPPEFAYLSYADRFYAQHETRPVILAASPAVALKFRPNGRCVIYYDRGRVYAQWMTTSAFTDAWMTQLDSAAQFEHQRRAQPVTVP